MRILLVEDDENIVEVLMAMLFEQNYVVDVAQDGEAGWQFIEAFSYDLVLLDVMLPKIDGITFCRRLRQHRSQVPVLLLTARDTTTDLLLGLDSGADDYVVKPFNAQELAARIRALLRRGAVTTSPVLVCGKLRLDPSTREVTYEGQPLRFSRKEYLLLELFLRNQHLVFSRRMIVDRLWSVGEDPPDEDTVKSHIRNIRRALKAVGAANLIETLYGQGYRLNPAYLKESLPPEKPALLQPSILDHATTEIWQRTKGVSLERVAFLEQVGQSIDTDSFDEILGQQAIQIAHKLVGSLGTFGFDEGSRLARQVEMVLTSELEPYLSSPPTEAPSPFHLRAEIADQVKHLVSALRRVLSGQQNWAIAAVKPAHPPSLLPLEQCLLLIIDSDRELAQSIAIESTVWKIRAAIASDLEAAHSFLQEERPHVILLDPAMIHHSEDRRALLAHLTTADPPPPILAFSAQDTTIDRVAVVQTGGQLFLQKPATPAQVLRAVVEVLQPSIDTKVFAVDDDPQFLLALKALLEPQGIQLNCLENPYQFWETLKSVQPDLLILDINMPGISGFELCQSVRQDFQWNWLPILFLSAYTDADTLQQGFAIGADDYLTKPLVPVELSNRIFNRLKRSRLLRSQAEIDSLTGISNRQQATQAFSQLLQFVLHSQQPLCLAVLDLDHFKQVNDQYGHIQGDRVLRQFGQFLKQKFRGGDVVARWGGEEFVVGICNVTREEGVERLSELLEGWRSLEITTPNGDPLQVSFSAGVAQYPIDGTTLQMLYHHADAALYQAKQMGRNRILTANWWAPDPSNQI
jgi:diguanylate cyclase (GGDEF)-like protein